MATTGRHICRINGLISRQSPIGTAYQFQHNRICAITLQICRSHGAFSEKDRLMYSSDENYIYIHAIGGHYE